MSADATSTSIREVIEARDRQFMETFRRGDAEGLAALYTTDGQAFPPNSEMASGAQAIQAVWQGAMDAGLKEARLEISEVEQHDDTAYEVGKYTLLVEGGQTADTGKYIVIWKQEGGQWKLHRDIWNSSRPAA